jgi:hypothetical protein
VTFQSKTDCFGEAKTPPELTTCFGTHTRSKY